MSSFARELAVAPVRLYRLLISPLIPARCKYYPTCSEYAVESIRTFGVLRGSVLAAWRLLRCNPWSRGGFDYPRDQTLFRQHHHHPVQER
jgi:putative membrane protein insertion efficiency factor